MHAIWSGEFIAEYADTEVVEGNHYFPVESVNMKFMKRSDTHTICPWKGVASYYSIEVGGKVNIDAAWYYPEPKKGASNVKGLVAFWKGVEVRE
jgi:uncharacterized protein (DUF427 family)